YAQEREKRADAGQSRQAIAPAGGALHCAPRAGRAHSGHSGGHAGLRRRKNHAPARRRCNRLKRTPHTMDSIVITDVALRDGLQNQKTVVSTENKIELARLLQKAGVTSIEATSFVSPKHVPQMADAEEVIRGLHAFPRVSALAPNIRALDRAKA